MRRGDIAVLSRAITLVESEKPEHAGLSREILEKLLPYTGHSFRVGITGVPGVGKSTFIEAFGSRIIDKGGKLAVIAIDPSSAASKGSILGDKTRMASLAARNDVFIRPSPSSGALGGVGRATYETILLCEAAGFDHIIVETVGVGQSETAVSRITDFFMLLMLAGAGDELQGIKRGIMELADAILITKADGTNAGKARVAAGEFSRAVHLLQGARKGWTPKVIICSAVDGTGMGAVSAMLDKFRTETTASGAFAACRQRQQLEILRAAIEQRIISDAYQRMDLSRKLESAAAKGDFNPFSEADAILGGPPQP